MKIIGLTGGIGTGKSTVSEYFSAKGIPIIDADKIAHEITEPGKPTLKKLACAFGSDIILEGDVLDRKALAKIAFSTPENTEKLGEITHGAIISEMERQLEVARNSDSDLAIIDAPLLVEGGLTSMCDVVFVVTADKDIRFERIRLRDGMNDEEISARISRQISDEERNKFADELIDNSKGKEELYNFLEQLLVKYA